MTQAQLLADYLGVTPDEYPGLYPMRFDTDGDPVSTLTTRVPGDRDLTPSEQAAWLLAMVKHAKFFKLRTDDGLFVASAIGGPFGVTHGHDAPTPDAACLAALLAADAEFAARWEAAG